MNSLTIDQCVEQINARLTEEGMPATMNVRLLRHYQQQKSIEAPTQDGRFAKYNSEHVETVVALRKAQDLGVSSKAYTAISSIEKHNDPHATVGSLGLGTPAWLGSSVVGALASSQNDTSLSNALNSVTSANSFLLGASASAGETPTTLDPRTAALLALNQLGSTPVSAKSVMNPKTIATLSRVVAASTTKSTPLPPKVPTREVTEWTLGHDVRVQIPTAALTAFNAEQQQAFEAWMAQLPDLS